MMDTQQKQTLFCHSCFGDVAFDVPADNGNLVVVCPRCKHEHYRIVKDGTITEDRWKSNYPSGTLIFANNVIAMTVTVNIPRPETLNSWISNSTGSTSGHW